MNSISQYQKFVTKVHETVQTYGSKTAVTYMRESGMDEKVSFEEMGAYISERSKIYSEMGLKKADRIAIVASHSPYTVMTGMSLTYSGIVMVLIDASLPLEEIEKLIGFAEVRAIFTTEEMYRNLSKEVKEEYPCLEVSSAIKCRYLQENGCPLKAAEYTTDEDVIAILFSSGATGQMKGIMVTYASVLKARDVFARLAGLEDYMTYLLVLPFNHIAGFTGVMTYFLTGCEVGFIENVNASKLQAGLLKFQPHYFAMLPKVYEVMEQKIRASVREKGKAVEVVINGLLKVSKFFRKCLGINIGRFLFKGITKQVFGERIYGIGTGASPCKDETTEFFLNLGLEWANLYATTETSVPIVATGVHDRYPVGTVGNVNHHPEIQVKIGKKDEQGLGEILVKSELMMKGYFKQPEMTKEVFDKEGYFKTGDYGFIDKKGYLHIKGRIKESIVLQSGKKVSPVDVDSYYSNRLDGIEVASRGITKADGQYDEIHLFLAQSELKEQRDAVDRIWEISRNAPQMYKIEGVHVLADIPKTSVGKVKRFLLEIPKADTIDYHTPGQEIKMVSGEAVKDVVIDLILRKLPNVTKEQLSMESKWKDIGLDSLATYEMVGELEELFQAEIANKIDDVKSVRELCQIVQENKKGSNNKKVHEQSYPVPRTKKLNRKLERWIKVSRKLYDFEISGKENLKENGILCANHASYFDPVWVLAAAGEEHFKMDKIACLAAIHTLKESPGFFNMLGGILVDRSGNTLPALKSAKKCLESGYTMIIFPEGARSRDGSMLPFKNGASKLSIETGKPIIPINIEGAFEIFPRNRRLPRLYDWKNRKKFKLKIRFGKPITPSGYEIDELTEQVRLEIERMH